jgi:hypothetical protein
MGEPTRFICENCPLVFESEHEKNPQECLKCHGKAIAAYSEVSMRGDILYCGGFIILTSSIMILLIVAIVVNFTRGKLPTQDFTSLSSITLFFIMFLFNFFLHYKMFPSFKKRYRLAWGKEWDDYDKEEKRMVDIPLKMSSGENYKGHYKKTHPQNKQRLRCKMDF